MCSEDRQVDRGKTEASRGRKLKAWDIQVGSKRLSKDQESVKDMGKGLREN